jgi:hypothetical protein
MIIYNGTVSAIEYHYQIQIRSHIRGQRRLVGGLLETVGLVPPVVVTL